MVLEERDGTSNYARRWSTARGGVNEREPCRAPQEAWTNFEEKYDRVGETTYELRLDLL